jgi:protein SCO1/2
VAISTSKTIANYTKIIGVIAVLIAVFVFITTDSDKDYKTLKKQLQASFLVHGSSQKLTQFSLVDHHQREFNNASLKGKWTLLLFIYTHCPDICPTELMDMSRLRVALLNSKLETVPEVVAVTFDPDRDTPEVLKTYVSYFNEDFLGVSGASSQIDKLVKSLGAYYEKVFKNKQGEEVIYPSGKVLPEYVKKQGYLVNHTARIYLISPDAQAFVSFPTPHNIEKMASDIELIIKAY